MSDVERELREDLAAAIERGDAWREMVKEDAIRIEWLREALAWYAEPASYAVTQAREPRSAAHCDGGRRAREALEVAQVGTNPEPPTKIAEGGESAGSVTTACRASSDTSALIPPRVCGSCGSTDPKVRRLVQDDRNPERASRCSDAFHSPVPPEAES